MKLRYDHIHLISRDPEAAVRFYCEHFGARETSRMERGGAPQVFLELGESTLIVRGIREGENPLPEGSMPRMGMDHFGFFLEGEPLDAFAEALRKKGVKVLGEVGEAPRARFFYVGAPDGVVVEILQAR
ncbi:MAG: VOC family protein [Nitrospinota bacterium]